MTKFERFGREEAIAALTGFIRAGGYRPGDRLPPERELIVSLGMSRSSLRRGLEALEHDGLIWRHVGKGTFIAAQGGAGGSSSLSELSRQVTPVQLMRARLALEPAIAREAAINASADEVARLKAIKEAAESAPDWDSYEAQDDHFHRAVAAATGNVLLLSLFDQMNQVRRAVAWNTVVRKSERPPRDHSSFAEHNALVDAIEARDPNAAQAAMRAHLGSVSKRLFEEH
ncbi:FadR/GntR family transcriptional regulator [Poseidonocella sedimentorum]|uniref:DNA-binding transcriptional regulator, FadR family n=1 Tax=Poseidonocella sedimentorum TaxID=871652 RepID=A0A1I6CSQ4_9RHOB|nr:FadR/GntR family transcriptional regulator [Poseidonocella sedimentorum]SFQ96199.1 DNA-binding transcriptional regulator, FadR family [Poseidonocella sedimentorum]